MMSDDQALSSAATEPHFYIMDLMSMAFRQFHALSRQDFFTSQGFPTSALYGMTRSLFELYRQEQPMYMVAASDSKAPTFRHKIFPGYKLKRQAMPEELEVQLPKLFELLHLLGIPVITQPGWEADDIIASLAKQYGGRRISPGGLPLQIRIVSGDKDMMQLVDEHTKLYQTTRGQQVELVGHAEVQAYFGVPPHKVTLAQALIGDPTDDVPGVAGIGKTTAAKLLAQVESLDELYAGLDELSSANLQKKLMCGRDNAYISEQLVTLATDVEFEFKLEDAAVQAWQWGDVNESLNKFLQKCEFRTLRKRYLPKSPMLPSLLPFAAPGAIAYEDEGGESGDSGGSALPSPLETPWRCDQQQVRAYLRKVQRYQLASDESGCLAPGLQAAVRSAELIFLTGGESESSEGLREGVVHLLLVENLAELWQAPSYEVTWPVAGGDPTWLASLHDVLAHMKMGVVYGSKSFMHQLVAWGFNPRDYALTDVQIIEGLVLGREASRSLGEAAQRELGPAYMSLLTDAAEQEIDDQPPLATLMVAALYLKWQAPTYRLDEMQYVLWHIETPLNYILFKMERQGVYVDRALLEKFSAWLAAEMAVVSAEVMNLAGESFNIQSPKQLGVILYDKLKLHEHMKVRIKKTKSGLSTRESALLKLLPHPLVVAVLRYRKLAKLQSTYATALPEMIKPQTGRIHTSFKQMGTATGRMSSERPNLQNIPIRTELGKEIRRAFRAPSPSRQMISADYSQIELRVLAHLSQDQNLIAAFKADQDIHQATAAHMLGKSLQQLTPQDRDMAKAINYGIVYGMGARRLAATLGRTVTQASELIDEYYRRFQGVSSYMKEVEQFAEQHGYTMTANGRMRIVGARDKARPGAGVARNSPVQGTAADLMKLAMIRVDKALTAAQLDCIMLLQIHDELLFECAQECVPAAMKLIRREMEAADNLQVPLKVTIGAGEHWLAAH